MIDMNHGVDKKDLEVDVNTALHVIALAGKGDELMEAMKPGEQEALNSVFIHSVDKLMKDKKAGVDL